MEGVGWCALPPFPTPSPALSGLCPQKYEQVQTMQPGNQYNAPHLPPTKAPFPAHFLQYPGANAPPNSHVRAGELRKTAL